MLVLGTEGVIDKLDPEIAADADELGVEAMDWLKAVCGNEVLGAVVVRVAVGMSVGRESVLCVGGTASGSEAQAVYASTFLSSLAFEQSRVMQRSASSPRVYPCVL